MQIFPEQSMQSGKTDCPCAKFQSFNHNLNIPECAQETEKVKLEEEVFQKVP
jgi:hypothetical protein